MPIVLLGGAARVEAWVPLAFVAAVGGVCFKRFAVNNLGVFKIILLLLTRISYTSPILQNRFNNG